MLFFLSSFSTLNEKEKKKKDQRKGSTSVLPSLIRPSEEHDSYLATTSDMKNFPLTWKYNEESDETRDREIKRILIIKCFPSIRSASEPAK